jgi:hypothetical protein
MSEQGIRDYSIAKRKAAERFGVRSRGALPSNEEIEERLAERQRIFEPQDRIARLRGLRRSAISLMEALAPYRPRLAGSVLAGTATINAVIELHAFCDTPEDVSAALDRLGIDYRSAQKRYRFTRENACAMPAYRFLSFVAGERPAEVLLVVFPEKGIRQAPLSPVDHQPMRRADCAGVRALDATA